MEDALKDERFKHILSDPRFRSMPRRIQKVTVDKRFKGMFKDKNFKGRGSVDKRGRPLNLTPSENLKNLYQVTSDSSENEEGEEIEGSQKGFHKMDVTKSCNKKNSKKKLQLSKQQEKSSDDDGELCKEDFNTEYMPKNLKNTMNKHSESLNTSKSFGKKEQSSSGNGLEGELSGEESIVSVKCKEKFSNIASKHSEGSLKKKKISKQKKLYNITVDSPQNHLTELSNKELSSIIDDDSKESSEAENNAISIVNAHLEAKHSETNSLKKKNSSKKSKLQKNKHAKSLENQLAHLSNKELSSIIDNDSKESTEEELHTKNALNRNLKNIKTVSSKKSNFTPKNKTKDTNVNFSKKHSTPISIKQEQTVFEIDSDDESSEEENNRNLFKTDCQELNSKNLKVISTKVKSVMKNKRQKGNGNSSRNLSTLLNHEQEQSDEDFDEDVLSEGQINGKDTMGKSFDKQKSKKLKTINSSKKESSNDSEAESSEEEMNLNVIESNSTGGKTKNSVESFSTKRLNSMSNKLSKKNINGKKGELLKSCVEQEQLSSEENESEAEMNKESTTEDNYNRSRIKPFKNATSKAKLPVIARKHKQSSDEDDDSDEESGEELNKESSWKRNSNIEKIKHSDSEDSDDSDDSESDSDDSSGNQNEDIDHRWEELRIDAPDTNDITQRLAVCNMDWDRIRAEDLYVCFKSFKPVDGWINSVKIYPSEFGLKRMEDEKLHGPAELVEETLPLTLDEEEPEDKKGSKHHREKLRQYQINRLKYYYAIVDCDSPETANVLYEQLNGMEYESSSIRYDLRFVPDDMIFEHEPVSVADSGSDLSNYQPKLFVNTALQQVKVNLTWDETDPKRNEVLQRAFTDPDSVQDDIRDYLASTSGESESDENEVALKEKHDKKVQDRIAAYKNLLQSIEEEEKEEKEKYEMEITWDPSLKEKTAEIVKEKMKKDTVNPFEEILQKRKEKRKVKKKEKKAMLRDAESHSGSDDSDESDSMSEEKARDAKKLAELALIADSKRETDGGENKSKKKRKTKKKEIPKKQDEENLKVDVNDPRFSAIYTSHAFNIDPTSPHFKKTEGNVALIKEKQRRLESLDYHNRNSKRARYS